ncbi:GH92 family glycosyl hydrolase [Lactiplantibacillus plantarum]|uniref:GH92 family glycosyl hydrolase n=1 Tax=Lactiplantibacillus plantarum TaxID=1590 RepID=UPI0010802B23|nr:GH92 family glycosyl hydrolase [Lactiplantibacillus plantarum]QBX92918.1 alpha-mannosidase [Lactiplantibacillus plantarum]
MKIDQIDIRQGTANSPQRSHGNCLPYSGVPFGMNYFAVQTNGANGAWFFQPDTPRFEGIRLTHQPSPWIGDYCHLLLMGVQWQDATKRPDFVGNYRPNEATFNAHHLAIYDDHFNVQTDLAPSTYGAIARYDFQQLELAHHGLMLQFSDHVTFEFTPTGVKLSVSDYHGGEDPNLTMYVELTISGFDRANSGYYDDQNHWFVTTEGHGHALTLLLASDQSLINCHLATSYVDRTQAQLNLKRLQDADLTALENVSAAQWNDYLSRVTIRDHHPELIQTFYTCMYRLFLFPQRFYELDAKNKPIHYDTKSKTIKSGLLYTNNGFWDTSKTVYALFSILAPELLPKFLAGFLTSYNETGFLPRWLAPDERGMMPGNLVDSIIAESAKKGIALELMPRLLAAMRDSDSKPAKNSRYGRQGSADYDRLGYIPADKYPESVNWTQDYAYSDYCIGQVADVLDQTDIANKYWQLSKRYLNLLDPQTGFLRPKNSDGRFKEPFVPDSWGSDYTEGSAWQNSYSAFHDINGLMTAMGGPKRFDDQLTALCNTRPSYHVGGYQMVIHEMSEMAAVDYGQVAISNQPSFHLPYLFSYTGHREKTQVLVKQLRKLFNASTTGFPGDEDNGSMAGWFIFACLGFYPVCPADAEYVLGIPAFDHVTLHTADHDIQLTTTNNHDHNNFVQTMTLNGHHYDQATISHQQLLNATNIDVRLGLVPASVTNK